MYYSWVEYYFLFGGGGGPVFLKPVEKSKEDDGLLLNPPVELEDWLNGNYESFVWLLKYEAGFCS